MNPLLIHYTNAEVDYRRERIADGMAAAAGWSRPGRSIGRHILALVHHESREALRI